jgi:uncharacterized protein
MPQAFLSIIIAGQEMSAAGLERVASVTVTTKSGKESDTCAISLDDRDGDIDMPAIKDKISIAFGNSQSGSVVQFEGSLDAAPKSLGARGSGRTLEITGTAADTSGKLKEQKEQHHDTAKLQDVATKWGKEAGLTSVKIDESLGTLTRDYWHMANESFSAWGARIARELGATFKVTNDKAAIVPRGSGKSASGKDLPPITAEWGKNLESWDITPKLGKPQSQKFDVRWFDAKKAKFERETVEAKLSDSTSTATERYRFGDKDSAKKRAGSLDKDSEREKGGGTIAIDGNAEAQPEANVTLIGSRPGIDGTYRIDSVTQKYSRDGSWTTSLEVKQPSGEAGKDSRKKTK